MLETLVIVIVSEEKGGGGGSVSSRFFKNCKKQDNFKIVGQISNTNL